jgi:hypothetical protein
MLDHRLIQRIQEIIIIQRERKAAAELILHERVPGGPRSLSDRKTKMGWIDAIIPTQEKETTATEQRSDADYLCSFRGAPMGNTDGRDREIRGHHYDFQCAQLFQ